MPNEQEAMRISQRDSLIEAVEWVRARGVPLVTVKRGVDGAQVYYEGGTHACAVTPATGGDSVGAGDSFDAGFLAGWLRGLPLERCLAIGCYCGRSVASAVGGVRGQPTWEDEAIKRFGESANQRTSEAARG